MQKTLLRLSASTCGDQKPMPPENRVGRDDRGHPRSQGARMRRNQTRRLPPHLWVLLGPLIIVLAYLLGLAVLDLLGAGYLRSLARRLFGV
jgi:hypothetical protein